MAGAPPGNGGGVLDEPPDAAPHARWCEREGGRPALPTRFRSSGVCDPRPLAAGWHTRREHMVYFSVIVQLNSAGSLLFTAVAASASTPEFHWLSGISHAPVLSGLIGRRVTVVLPSLP